MNSETAIGSARKATGWSIVWGILMLICGMLAIAMPLASSIGLVILLGWLLLFAAIWHLIFAFHSKSLGGILWKVLLAILYGFVAVYMLVYPVGGVASLTLLLACFLLVEGVMEIILFFNIRHASNSGWVLLDGIITLILGGLIWFQWPSSSVWVIGTLIGISLIFSGISRIMLSSAIRRLTPAAA